MADTKAFMAALLQPVAHPLCAEMIADLGLADEAEAIAEAREMVATITAVRDGCRWGSRERAVQNIMLDWWRAELGNLTGFHAEGR